MSDIAALAAGRPIEVSDGAYLERAEIRELALEEHLRGWVAHLPHFASPAKRSRKMVRAANALEPATRELDDAALLAGFREACKGMRREGFSDALVARAFAAVREASRRTLGLRHHDVQLVGGWVLLKGRVAEMATGEGKTLVATLAAATAAAAGAAVHVITVNDYLAARDAEVNAPLYAFLGLSVGVVKQDMELGERRTQYARNIVYVSNKEVVFDYLKDRIAATGTLGAHLKLRNLYRPGRKPAMLLRGLHVAIVDEADSVLIDEARTPLIISETIADEHGGELYAKAIALAGELTAGEHYQITKEREVWLTPPGEDRMRALAADLPGVWTSARWRRELTQKALSALHCFHRDQHYIVAEDKVQIVDEFTGRVMPDRSWEQGLHQMIETKEGCEITGQRKTLSRMTYQRYFRRYLLLGGMTGTAKEVEPELKRVYELEVVPVPTNKAVRRTRLPDLCWREQEERWQAVAQRAADLGQAGKAVLIGTRSVDASERLSALLTLRGVVHAVLNARQDKSEADTVAEAGQPGRITVATNMAGRGTDIHLAPEVSASGGLHVILTEFHESARIDRQLFGRSARQGEPGVVQAMVALDDDLFTRYAPVWRAFCSRVTPAGRRVPGWLLRLLVRAAQAKAERRNRKIRLETQKQDRKLQDALGFAGATRS